MRKHTAVGKPLPADNHISPFVELYAFGETFAPWHEVVEFEKMRTSVFYAAYGEMGIIKRVGNG